MDFLWTMDFDFNFNLNFNIYFVDVMYIQWIS